MVVCVCVCGGVLFTVPGRKPEAARGTNLSTSSRLNFITHAVSLAQVLHGGGNDVTWLQRDFRLYLVNVFDTEKAAAVLAYDSRALAGRGGAGGGGAEVGADGEGEDGEGEDGACIAAAAPVVVAPTPPLSTTVPITIPRAPPPLLSATTPLLSK